MKILITSTSHKNYNQTGMIVSSATENTLQGVQVILEKLEEIVFVPEGQFKLIRDPAFQGRDI